MPDSRSELVKERVRRDIQSRLDLGRATGAPLDLKSGVKYSCTDDERAEQQMDEAEGEDDLELDDTSRKEFIFFIDRSMSMYNTIQLARQALTLFLYSLPAGSKFNVCSYGSRHEFMFEGRSVDYND